MKRTATYGLSPFITRAGWVLIFVIIGLAIVAIFAGQHAYALAAQPDPPPVPTPTVAMQTITAEPAAPTIALTPTPRIVTPTPSPTPEWPNEAEYDDGEFRCIARFRRTCVSDKATWVTQIVACEVPQNRSTQPGFPDTFRYVLLQPYEFAGYDPSAKPRKCDREAADYVMRSFAEALEGNFAHRYTPLTGIYLRFSDDNKYCRVYDKDWNLLCDTSQFG